MDAEYPGGWGNKDPRTLLVLDEWRRQLGDRLVLVGIFRHPGAVATSLLARELQPRDRIRGRRQAVRLWNAYCERLVAAHESAPFPLIRFDTAPAALDDQLTKTLRGLALPLQQAPATFTPELVHEGGPGPVPRRCRRVWSYLLANQVA
jgi:hypothetical protein